MVGQSSVPPDAAAMTQRLKTFLITGGVVVLTALAVVFAAAQIQAFSQRRRGRSQGLVLRSKREAALSCAARPDSAGRQQRQSGEGRCDRLSRHGERNQSASNCLLGEIQSRIQGAAGAGAGGPCRQTPVLEKIPSQNSPGFQDNTLVKRPGEASWHAVSTEEARQIMAEWREWRGPAGQRPIISVPSIQ